LLQLTTLFFLKKKLHILFLCSWYPSRVLPTNGDFIQRHAEAVSLLHKVTVLHIISDKKSRKKTTIVFRKINDVRTYIGYIKYSKNPIIKYYRFFSVYKKILKSINKIDLVHLNVLYPFGVFALHLKWVYKLPYIISEHWTGYLYPQNRTIGFIKKTVSKIITKKASFVCPVSNLLGKSMQEIKLFGNYKTIANTVNTVIFKPINKKETQFTILHISSMLDKHKNISDMLRAAKILENTIGFFTWKFIGGNMKNYEPLINELQFTKATIIFMKHISQKKLIAHIQKSHLLVSFSNYETFGITIIEAIACGVPVIATNTGVARNSFLKNYCITTPLKDIDSLNNHIVEVKKKASKNPKERHQFVVDNFSNMVIAKKLSTLYYKTLSQIS